MSPADPEDDQRVHIAREVRAGRRPAADFDAAFAQATIYAQRAPGRPGVMAAELPGKGHWVLVFSTAARLARWAGDCPWLRSTGADLLGRLPAGLGVLLDISVCSSTSRTPILFPCFRSRRARLASLVPSWHRSGPRRHTDHGTEPCAHTSQRRRPEEAGVSSGFDADLDTLDLAATSIARIMHDMEVVDLEDISSRAMHHSTDTKNYMRVSSISVLDGSMA